MGDHYVPRYYLNGFSKDGGKTIWVYDKKDRRKFSTQVKSIANETSFYSPEVEQYLANSVEGPANNVLEKIRERAKITTVDKKILSAYMTCMMKRVPRGKQRLKELAPSVAEKVEADVDKRLNVAASEQPERLEFIEKRRTEIREIIDRFSVEPPKEIWLTSMPPEKSPRILAALSRMTWRFFTFDKYPAFLTSDNPVFYFTSMGIGNPESEVTFPVSSHIALWATWRLDLEEGYFETNTQVVKELTRRTASFATRYAFHSIDVEWVLPILNKGRWQLNRIK